MTTIMASSWFKKSLVLAMAVAAAGVVLWIIWGPALVGHVARLLTALLLLAEAVILLPIVLLYAHPVAVSLVIVLMALLVVGSWRYRSRIRKTAERQGQIVE